MSSCKETNDLLLFKTKAQPPWAIEMQYVVLHPFDGKEKCPQHKAFVFEYSQQIQANCSNAWYYLEKREILQYLLMKKSHNYYVELQ